MEWIQIYSSALALEKSDIDKYSNLRLYSNELGSKIFCIGHVSKKEFVHEIKDYVRNKIKKFMHPDLLKLMLEHGISNTDDYKYLDSKVKYDYKCIYINPKLSAEEEVLAINNFMPIDTPNDNYAIPITYVIDEDLESFINLYYDSFGGG